MSRVLFFSQSYKFLEIGTHFDLVDCFELTNIFGISYKWPNFNLAKLDGIGFENLILEPNIRRSNIQWIP
uniref:Uncharacterized protein n=1 Tax=Rhizophora mucronata TaxID=61149 RepID=A0A2P2Q080_RHIMU